MNKLTIMLDTNTSPGFLLSKNYAKQPDAFLMSSYNCRTCLRDSREKCYTFYNKVSPRAHLAIAQPAEIVFET